MKQGMNVAALLVALGLATASGLSGSFSCSGNRAALESAPPAALRDASGRMVPLKAYTRIASASSVADDLLLQLVEPERIVAFTEYTARTSADAHRFSGKALIRSVSDIEQILALKPDLLLLNIHGAAQQVARLEEAGIRVFDLGAMIGVQSFVATIRALGTLVGRSAFAEQYATQFQRRLERVALDVEPIERRRALYVSIFGTKIYGSGSGTNYQDILFYAGIEDVAAEHYQGFPEYSAEQLLALRPPLLITRSGMRETVCRYPGLEQLPVCADSERLIVEVPEELIASSGVEMLAAAELIHDAVYGVKTAPSGPAPAQNNPR